MSFESTASSRILVGYPYQPSWRTLRYGLGKIDRFSKEAVVAENGWISKFSEIGNKLFKSIEVKHFLPGEKDKAVTWIQE